MVGREWPLEARLFPCDTCDSIKLPPILITFSSNKSVPGPQRIPPSKRCRIVSRGRKTLPSLLTRLLSNPSSLQSQIIASLQQSRGRTVRGLRGLTEGGDVQESVERDRRKTGLNSSDSSWVQVSMAEWRGGGKVDTGVFSGISGRGRGLICGRLEEWEEDEGLEAGNEGMGDDG
ncbi:unnamed protein product [Allacma fusca]|uniref:Uncharacterized protein n=1 Tax=Allacma fusca TaxID=39272 RepID=A0A8J2KXN2_9HEXA|nr:unnamed protein product [Allacma fusca]